MGAETVSSLCDLGVFADQAAEPVASEDARTGYRAGRTRPPGAVLPDNSGHEAVSPDTTLWLADCLRVRWSTPDTREIAMLC